MDLLSMDYREEVRHVSQCQSAGCDGMWYLNWRSQSIPTIAITEWTMAARTTTPMAVSNIGFITVHGLNEGHIAPYIDIEFQLTKYQTYITMKSQDKSLQLIFEETITLLTKIKRVK